MLGEKSSKVRSQRLAERRKNALLGDVTRGGLPQKKTSEQGPK